MIDLGAGSGQEIVRLANSLMEDTLCRSKHEHWLREMLMPIELIMKDRMDLIGTVQLDYRFNKVRFTLLVDSFDKNSRDTVMTNTHIIITNVVAKLENLIENQQIDWRHEFVIPEDYMNG